MVVKYGFSKELTMRQALLLLALVLSGCGANPAAAVISPSASPTAELSPSPSTSPLPNPTPAIVVRPAQARIRLTLKFIAAENALGDVTFILRATVSSNIPVKFSGYFVRVIYKQQNLIIDPVASNFDMEPGIPREYLFTFPGTIGRGTYTVFFDVPSYSNDSSHAGLQTDAYVAWVGGQRGELLRGNPQAINDPDHPAVLSLRAKATITK